LKNWLVIAEAAGASGSTNSGDYAFDLKMATHLMSK
jgi:hypothetical protein